MTQTLHEQILQIAYVYNEIWAKATPFPRIVDALARNAFVYTWPDGVDTRAIRRAAQLQDDKGSVPANEPAVL